MRLTLGIMVFLIAMSCAHVRAEDPYTYPAPQNEEDCMRLYHDILNVQDERAIASNKMTADTKKLKAGEITKEAYHHKRMEWLATEGRLRYLVTYLYDIGYANGCFNS